jgi:uncharacterized membrane protein
VSPAYAPANGTTADDAAGSLPKVTTFRPSVERLLYFTDAMVAIAATLLVLPLVDEAAAYFRENGPSTTAAGFLSENGSALVAFVISFAVIARLWVSHHRLFTPITALDRGVVALDLCWAFTLVFLPLPTQITALYPTERSAIALYTGTMLVSSLLLLALVVHVRRTPSLASIAPPVAGCVATSVLFAAALVLGVAFTSYLPLLLLLLGGLLARVLEPRLDPATSPLAAPAAE